MTPGPETRLLRVPQKYQHPASSPASSTPSGVDRAGAGPIGDTFPPPPTGPDEAAISITLDLWPHPLTGEGRSTRLLSVAPGATLADVMGVARGEGLAAECAVECDGEPVLTPADWARPLEHGAIVVVRPRGADGLRTILQLATLFAAIYVPGLPYFANHSVSWLGKAVGAGIMIGGNLVTNALVPPRVPRLELQDAGEPVYSLSAGSNRARPWEPLALVLGTHRIYPDLAAHPYTELRGEDQYLFQIFDLGLGDALDVSDLHIGDTPIDTYDDADLERALAGGAISTVAGDVHTAMVSRRLDWPDEENARVADWIVERSAPGTNRLALDLVGTLFGIDGSNTELQSMDVEIATRRIVAGIPRMWRVATTYTFQNDSRYAYRQTVSLDVELGEYDVRVRRKAAPPEALSETAELSWAALRSYQPDTGDYAGRNRLGLVLRASGQLSGRLDRVSAVVAQKVPVWAGSWSEPQATSNPAWIFRWLALGVWTGTEGGGDRRLVAGAGLPASQIDDEALRQWGAWCDAESLTCNYVARAETLQRLLELVAQCGRATLSWAGGRLGVVWDAANRAATALVTPANIVTGSYRTRWLGERVADEIVGRYVDANRDYERHEVRRIAGGATTVQISVSMDLPGVTDRGQAQQEVNLQAARQVYHRRRHEWAMPLGALPAGRGDVVYVTHSLIDGGQAGRLDAIGAGAEVTLSEPVTLDPTAQLLISLSDGRLYKSTALAHPAGVASPSARLELTPALPAPQGDDPAWDPLDCIWRFYGGDLTGAVRIVSITPAEDGIARIEAIDETPAYYAAKDLAIDQPILPPGQSTPRVIAAEFTSRLFGPQNDLIAIHMTLIVDGDWRGGIVYVVEGENDTRRQVARLIDGDTTADWIDLNQDVFVFLIIPGTVAAPFGSPFRTEYRPHSAALITVCPAEDGWPGEITGFVVSDNALIAGATSASYDWTTPRTWDVWDSWAGGPGTSFADSGSYTARPVTFGGVVTWGLSWTASVVGTVTVHVRHAATEAELATAAWVTEDGQAHTSRWVQVRWQLTAPPPLLRLANLCYSFYPRDST